MGLTWASWVTANPGPEHAFFNVVPKAYGFFLVFIAIEAGTSLALAKRWPSPRHIGANLAAGALQSLVAVLLGGLPVFPYVYIHDKLGLGFLRADSPLAFAASLLAVDFSYYWVGRDKNEFHRACHSANILWAAHAPHHSSDDYTLATALRQGVGEIFVNWAFHLPFALIIPPRTYFFVRSINTVYQFWVHTELVDNLGPVEEVMVTPSHHRVHHAHNYPQGNFAGMFILWDRLFGTFVRGEREKRPPKYGLGRPQLTWNALWHQMEALMEAVRLVPEVGVVGALLTRSKGRAGRGSGEESLRGKGAYLEDGYAWVQFAAAVWLFFRFLPMAVSLGPRGAAEAAVMIAWAFVGATSLLDIHPASSEGQRRRILSWEAVRLGACFVAVRTGSGFASVVEQASSGAGVSFILASLLYSAAVLVLGR